MEDKIIKLVPGLNQQLKISVAKTRKSTKWHNETITWQELLTRLENPVITDETPAQWKKYSRDKRADIKDVGGFVGGWLKNGRRQANNAEHRSLLTLDADFPDHNLWEDLQLIFDNTAAIYSTHNYTKENPRIRLIIPLSRTVTAEEYIPIARKVAEMLDMNNFDDTTYQPERMMFWPSASKGGDYFFAHQEGELLDPDTVLAEYDDWTDSSYWPTSDRELEVHEREIKRQGDPLTKPGIIGAFNRTYDIKAAIDTFLADVYEPSGNDDRYTYVGGSTSQGLVLYDDKFAYSNHGTDPASGQLCSAFDLVRIQKFHDLDEKAKPGLPVNKLPSYEAMNGFAMEDKAVYTEWQKEITGSALEDFDDLPDDDEDEAEELDPWLTYTKKGQPLVNQYLLARHVLAAVPIFYNSEEFLWYDQNTGLWESGAETYLRSLLVKKYLIKLSQIRYIRETTSNIQGLAFVKAKFPQSDKSKLVLADGIYDITNNTFSKQFTPAIHARTRHPIEYDPAATCETFDGYLKWAVGEENVQFMYEWIGYLFYRDYPIQKMLFLLGPGGTGKSTLINIMQRLVGPEAYSAVSLESLMTKNFAAADLYQKTANFDSDAKPEYLNDGAVLKTLTGEDTVHADVKYSNALSFNNFAKLTFAMNKMPAMRDFSGGLKRRAVIIPVKSVVTKEVKEAFPLDKIYEEVPGIFNKAMEGLRHLLARKEVKTSETSKNELDEWIRGNDQVKRFVEEVCQVDKDASVSGDDLYLTYNEYAQESGEKPMGKYRFYQRLEEMGFTRERRRAIKGGNAQWIWSGLVPTIDDFD